MRGLTLFFLAAIVTTLQSTAQTNVPYAVSTLAGTGALGDGGPATSALLEFPQSVVVDASGKIYIGDSGDGLIRVVGTDGTIQTFVFGVAASMKLDSAGNIYASDGVSRIYKVSPKGSIAIFAGSDIGYSGDNGPAVSAKLAGPRGVAVDALNNVYVADTFNQVIRKITPDGNIQTIAGNGLAAFGKEGISALSSPLAYPSGVEIDGAGNLYISEEFRIRKINSSGVINTIAGNGASPVDGAALNSAIGEIVALAMDSSSNLYLSDAAYNMVRMISPSGRITTLAGTGTAGFAGDGTFGFRALLNTPMGLAVDSHGNVFVADESNQRIRELTEPAGIMSTVAGASHYAGDGGPATAAIIHRPEHAITDGAGNVYISDTDNNVIRKVDTKGVITTIAGTGQCTYSGDLGKATAANLCVPEAITFDALGNLYIADWGNSVVRRIDTKGIITTVAGNGQYGDNGSIGNATSVPFEGPYGLAFDAKGNLFISDNTANRVRVLSPIATPPGQYPNGMLALFAGNGTAGSTGDGGLSGAAELNAPAHIAVGTDGSVYIADSLNDKVRKVVPATPGSPGIITSLSNIKVASLPLAEPDGVVVDAANNIYVSWEGSDVITRTTAAGVTSVLAGNGSDGFSGDGGLASGATFSGPAGLSVDAAGDFYMADLFNNRVRVLTLDTLTGMTASSGDGQSGNVGTGLASPLIVNLSFRGGVGIPGIPVTFAVTSGSASLTLQSTVTDALGNAGVGVTLGNTPGPVVITASTAGVSPVQFHLTVISSVPLPTIATNAIVGAGGSTPAVTQISPGGFATIFGSNFAPAGTFQQPSTATWPTQLAGVCVTVGGLPAYVTFVSPGQINIQVPSVAVNTNANVQVTTNCGTAEALQSAVQAVATLPATPEFLYWLKNANGQNPVVTVNAITNAYVGAAGLIAGLTFTPAKPGDILTIYGISFGATNPASVPGTPPAAVANSIYTPSVKLGTITLDPTAVLYAGVSPGTAGLYQLNIQVPANLPDGDYPVVLTLGSFSTATGGFVTVKN